MRKQVLVSADRRETRVAILEAEGSPAPRPKGKGGPLAKVGKDWRLAEFYIERRGGRSIVGNVYKARVDNVVIGLEAAFIDIGREKNGFLHVDDIVLPGQDAPRRGARGRGGTKINDLLKPGQEIVVQVTKDPLKTKGARLTMQLSIAGRYMVYMPQGEGIGFSRRLDDKERDRLRKETHGVDLGGGGAIVRTAARGAKKIDFEREILYLHKLHEVLQRRVEQTPAPGMVFQEADLPVRVLRDVFSDQFDGAVIDSEDQRDRMVSFLDRTAPDLSGRVELFREGKKPIFEEYGVEAAVAQTLERRVDLPSGGYLVIDMTEALTVIDVNSGSFTGRGKSRGLEDTITKTNLEAAEEAVRQIRLRDIGGIIVIDFIDMARASNRDAVLKTMRKSLDEDRTKTHVVEISPLGLVEMTRQNVTDGVREIMTKPCPTCSGQAVVLSEETVAISIERKLREHAAANPKPQAYLVEVHPKVANALIHGVGDPLGELEAETGKLFFFEGGDGLPLEHFAISMEGTRRKIEVQALPFHKGDEVMVHLIEPHMYEENAAVAKLDSFVIAVSDSLEHIGARCLVRIDEVGRNSANATIVGDIIPSEKPKVKPAPKPAGERLARRTRTAKSKPKAQSKPRSKPVADSNDDKPATAVAEDGSAEAAEDGSAEAAEAGSEEAKGDGVESDTPRKPRRRGRRGGRGRSRSKTQSTDG